MRTQKHLENKIILNNPNNDKKNEGEKNPYIYLNENAKYYNV